MTGGGAVGRHLAVDLVERGHEVTLIEQNRALADKLRSWAQGVNVVFGDACEPWVLEEAQMAQRRGASWPPPATTRTTW